MITTKPLKATCVDGDRHRRHGDACLARDRRGRALCVLGGLGRRARRGRGGLTIKTQDSRFPVPSPRMAPLSKFLWSSIFVLYAIDATTMYYTYS